MPLRRSTIRSRHRPCQSHRLQLLTLSHEGTRTQLCRPRKVPTHQRRRPTFVVPIQHQRNRSPFLQKLWDPILRKGNNLSSDWNQRSLPRRCGHLHPHTRTLQRKRPLASISSLPTTILLSSIHLFLTRRLHLSRLH